MFRQKPRLAADNLGGAAREEMIARKCQIQITIIYLWTRIQQFNFSGTVFETATSPDEWLDIFYEIITARGVILLCVCVFLFQFVI